MGALEAHRYVKNKCINKACDTFINNQLLSEAMDDITMQRITIVSIRKPQYKNINEELQWLGASLGLFNLRDKDKSCFRLFIALLKASRTGKGLSSDQLTDQLKLSRGTTIHHLNKLMEAGMVIKNRNVYLLRVTNLHALIEEVEKDTKRITEALKDVASEVDKWMGL